MEKIKFIDLLEKFSPLNEEEQKYLFYVILTSLDELVEMGKNSKRKGFVQGQYDAFDFVKDWFIEPNEEMKKLNVDHRASLIDLSKKEYDKFIENKGKKSC